jgi:hypothetical protein
VELAAQGFIWSAKVQFFRVIFLNYTNEDFFGEPPRFARRRAIRSSPAV